MEMNYSKELFTIIYMIEAERAKRHPNKWQLIYLERELKIRKAKYLLKAKNRLEHKNYAVNKIWAIR